MTSWKCSNCDYELKVEQPPEECPSCRQKCVFVDNTCYTPDCSKGQSAQTKE